MTTETVSDQKKVESITSYSDGNNDNNLHSQFVLHLRPVDWHYSERWDHALGEEGENCSDNEEITSLPIGYLQEDNEENMSSASLSSTALEEEEDTLFVTGKEKMIIQASPSLPLFQTENQEWPESENAMSPIYSMKEIHNDVYATPPINNDMEFSDISGVRIPLGPSRQVLSYNSACDEMFFKRLRLCSSMPTLDGNL